MRNILVKAKMGDELALNDLAEIIRKDSRVQARLSYFKHRNVLLEPDDAEGEFNVGVAKGIKEVDPDIGDPLLFLAQKGVWEIKSAIRKIVRASIVKTETGTDYRFVSLDFVKQPEEPAIDHELITEIKSFIGSLSEREKEIMLEVLNNNALDGVNYLRGIGNKLGCSDEAIAVHIRSIRKKYARFSGI